MEVRVQRQANIPSGPAKLAAMKPLFKIFNELRPYIKLIGLNQIICLITLAIGFSVPFTLKWLTEQVQAGNYSVLIWLPAISFFLLVSFVIIQMFRSVISQYISIKISQNLQKRILKRFLDDDIVRYSSQPTGEKISRMTYDIHWFVEGAAIFLSETLYLPLVIIGCVSMMIYLDWRIACVAIFVSPLSLLANKAFVGKLRKSSIELQEHNALLSRHIFDTLKGMLLIKVFAREEAEQKQFSILLDSFVTMQVKNNIWGTLLKTTISIGNAFVVCFVCWFAFYLLTDESQSLSVATFVAFSSVMFYFFGEIAKIGGIMNVMIKASVSCDRIYTLLEETCDREETGTEEAVFQESLIFEDVTFGYGDESVLKCVNIELKRGETIALMGMSGAGKTTLIHLMLGLLTPKDGLVTMDGRERRNFNNESWRNVFSYAPQLNALFFMSVADNIAYSRPGASRKDVEEAAKIACADDFIRSLPQGYDTIIGEEGANLSEGQRQRIALARAIIRNAPIIILDETSAHVDLITEQKIYQNIMALPDKTIVIVSHRPGVLKEANTIYSIADGELVDVGSFGDYEEHVGHGKLLRALEFIH